MLTPAQLVSAVREYCRTHAQPERAGKWARYFSEGYDSWGLLDKGHPIFTTQLEAWAAEFASLGLPGLLEAGRELFQSGKYEEGSVAILLVKPYREQIKASTLPGVAGWFDGGIRNWAHADVICAELLAPLLAAGRLKPAAFRKWRTSPHRFQRRAAAVAMLGLLKVEGGPAEALAFIEPLMEDTEKVVHQGLGWVIKEVWKREPALAESFLLRWKDRSARLIISTACEKMPAAAKARFRRTAKT
jgi:3-methyladenine DNA glycosylase AlkD